MSISSQSDKITFIKTRYLFVWFLFFYLVFSTLYSIGKNLLPILPNLEDPIVIQTINSLSFISLCLYLVLELRLSKLHSRYLIGNLRPTYPWRSLFGLTIIFILFSLGSALLSFYGLSLIVPEFHESFMNRISEQESRESVLPIINRCLQIINYVAIAPITEEFIFRGVLLHRLASKWNLPVAIWLSSIIFGLLHPNPVGIATVGIAWALLYIKTRTLVVPIIAHSMNNAIAVVIDLFSVSVEQSNTVTDSTSNMTSNEWIAGLFLVAVSLPFVVRFIYRRFPSKGKSLPYFANAAESN